MKPLYRTFVPESPTQLPISPRIRRDLWGSKEIPRTGFESGRALFRITFYDQTPAPSAKRLIASLHELVEATRTRHDRVRRNTRLPQIAGVVHDV